MAVRFSTIHRRAFYAMHAHYRILTTNACKMVAEYILGYFTMHTYCYLLTTKSCIEVAECWLDFITAAAVLRSQETRPIRAPGAKRLSLPFPKGGLEGMSIFFYF